MDSQLCRLLELLRTIPDTEFEDEEEDEDEDEYEEEEDEVEEEQEEEGEEEDKETRGEKGEEAVDNVLNNQRDKKRNSFRDDVSQGVLDVKQEDKTVKSLASEHEKKEEVGRTEHVEGLNPAQKAIVRNFDLPKILPGLDLKTNSNFLLFGPGGTGKRTLAKFIAEVANAELVHIEVRHVLSK